MSNDSSEPKVVGASPSAQAELLRQIGLLVEEFEHKTHSAVCLNIAIESATVDPQVDAYAYVRNIPIERTDEKIGVLELIGITAVSDRSELSGFISGLDTAPALKAPPVRAADEVLIQGGRQMIKSQMPKST
jgi:hypothetical protein